MDLLVMGAPAPEFMVPLTGLMILLGGLSVLLGAYARVGLSLASSALLIAYFGSGPYSLIP